MTLEHELLKDVVAGDLQRAMSYAVLAGGKRLRPLLTLAVSQTFGVAPEKIVKAASAVELMHTYSLIHDDLPAMDDDQTRRGQPTTHIAFGEAIAILAGDALQPLAFQWLIDPNLRPDQQADLVMSLAKASGGQGMVAGQIADMAATNGDTLLLADLEQLHLKKTGALLAYSMVAGGVMADVSSRTQEQLVHFGQAFGLAFQIKDDLQDGYQDDDENKQSYLQLLGAAGAKKYLTKHVQLAKAALADLTDETGIDVSLLMSSLAYFDDMVEK
ncbi:polyprenyl synthetase family protein [Weissella diestrammenae]|uniref:Farnesyl diphosphate synthase n=2 Tax=Weissella diestrammenae TaxID=1162633 RepID=A0A7G9T7N5_9LACO|nr:polyprenyl synthetase family protein [Weissella diestrammenae]MCM0583472.1 polyprenyl synthetase family protein [Weissella diestrammenae]QNN76110.1 polyprenyl synthetase family protein [Weissella diestrammenae]